jgi:hypothetical protein
MLASWYNLGQKEIYKMAAAIEAETVIPNG